MNTNSTMLLLIATTLNVSISFGQVSEDWYATDTTGKLQEIIAEFRSNYEQVHSQRHAFFCKGTKTRSPEGAIILQEIVFLGLFDTRDVQLHANSWVGDTTRKTFTIEQWDQHLRYQNKLYQRWGPFNGDIRETLEGEEEIQQAKASFVRFDPIDMSLSADGSANVRGPRPHADRLFTAGKLVEAKFTEDGDILHVIETKGSTSGKTIRTVFLWSKRLGYFPVSTDFCYVRNFGKESRFEPLSLVLTDWRRVDSLMVPIHLTIISRRKQHENQQMELAVEYVFEPKLPASPIVTPEMSDWREPLRVLFNANWQHKGNGPIVLFNPNRN